MTSCRSGGRVAEPHRHGSLRASINRPNDSDIDLPGSRERQRVVIRPLAGARGYRIVQSSKDVGMTLVLRGQVPSHCSPRFPPPPRGSPVQKSPLAHLARTSELGRCVHCACLFALLRSALLRPTSPGTRSKIAKSPWPCSTIPVPDFSHLLLVNSFIVSLAVNSAPRASLRVLFPSESLTEKLVDAPACAYFFTHASVTSVKSVNTPSLLASRKTAACSSSADGQFFGKSSTRIV